MYDWEPRVLLRHYLEQGLSKTAIAERVGISRHCVYNWIASGDLDRDIDPASIRDPPRPTQFDPYHPPANRLQARRNRRRLPRRYIESTSIWRISWPAPSSEARASLASNYRVSPSLPPVGRLCRPTALCLSHSARTQPFMLDKPGNGFRGEWSPVNRRQVSKLPTRPPSPRPSRHTALNSQDYG